MNTSPHLNETIRPDDKYLEISEIEAKSVFEICKTGVTVVDIYYSFNSHGEEIVEDCIPCYLHLEDGACFKPSASEDVSLEQDGREVFVKTKYYVHLDDVVLH